VFVLQYTTRRRYLCRVDGGWKEGKQRLERQQTEDMTYDGLGEAMSLSRRHALSVTDHAAHLAQGAGPWHACRRLPMPADNAIKDSDDKHM
jgi:hypothetical protein